MIFTRALNRLERLSSSIDFIHKEEAVKTVKSVMQIVIDRADALISEVYLIRKKEQSDDGSMESEFKKFAGEYHKDAPGHKVTGHTYQINKEKPGLWTWYYSNYKMNPLWFEDVKVKPAINAIDDSIRIPDEFLIFNPPTRSCALIPIVREPLIREPNKPELYRSEATFLGILNIEYSNQRTFDQGLLKEFERMSKIISTLIWKNETLSENINHTKEQVDLYITENCNHIGHYTTKTAFFQPSPSPDLVQIRIFLKDFLLKKGIKLLPDLPISPTVEQIKRSHLGVLDLTKADPYINLIIQILVEEGKELLLLRETNTDVNLALVEEIDPLPFLFDYSFINGKIENEDALRDTLSKFLEKLNSENLAFRNAAEYIIKDGDLSEKAMVTYKTERKLFRKIRIFVLSPSDVIDERETLDQIVNEINSSVGKTHRLSLQTYRWERDIIPKIEDTAQGIINQQTAEYDIYIGIMGSRFDTPTGDFGSGTKDEFEEAYRRWAKVGSPWIMFFFRKDVEYNITSESLSQLLKVVRFKEKSESMGILCEYRKQDGGFYKTISLHLNKLIFNHFSVSDAAGVGPH